MTTPASPPSPSPAKTAADGPPAGMIKIPAGPFKAGAKGDEEVTLPDFWIDATPVTNKQYAAFVAATGRRQPSHWGPDGYEEKDADLPVVCVTFADAEAYAAWAGKLLPTPAQFEKAARGTDGRKYPWGDMVGLKTGNTRETGLGRPSPVEAYPRGKSPYGCFDMNANVLHWTRAKVSREPDAAVVLKGCSFKHYLGSISWSYDAPPTQRQDCVGFRCVWAPKA